MINVLINQTQRIEDEIILPRGPVTIRVSLILYGVVTIKPNVISRVKKYAMLSWKRPTDENEGNLQRWMCELTHY